MEFLNKPLNPLTTYQGLLRDKTDQGETANIDPLKTLPANAFSAMKAVPEDMILGLTQNTVIGMFVHEIQDRDSEKIRGSEKIIVSGKELEMPEKIQNPVKNILLNNLELNLNKPEKEKEVLNIISFFRKNDKDNALFNQILEKIQFTNRPGFHTKFSKLIPTITIDPNAIIEDKNKKNLDGLEDQFVKLGVVSKEEKKSVWSKLPSLMPELAKGFYECLNIKPTDSNKIVEYLSLIKKMEENGILIKDQLENFSFKEILNSSRLNVSQGFQGAQFSKQINPLFSLINNSKLIDNLGEMRPDLLTWLNKTFPASDFTNLQVLAAEIKERPNLGLSRAFQGEFEKKVEENLNLLKKNLDAGKDTEYQEKNLVRLLGLIEEVGGKHQGGLQFASSLVSNLHGLIQKHGVTIGAELTQSVVNIVESRLSSPVRHEFFSRLFDFKNEKLSEDFQLLLVNAPNILKKRKLFDEFVTYVNENKNEISSSPFLKNLITKGILIEKGSRFELAKKENQAVDLEFTYVMKAADFRLKFDQIKEGTLSDREIGELAEKFTQSLTDLMEYLVSKANVFNSDDETIKLIYNISNEIIKEFFDKTILGSFKDKTPLNIGLFKFIMHATELLINRQDYTSLISFENILSFEKIFSESKKELTSQDYKKGEALIKKGEALIKQLKTIFDTKNNQQNLREKLGAPFPPIVLFLKDIEFAMQNKDMTKNEKGENIINDTPIGVFGNIQRQISPHQEKIKKNPQLSIDLLGFFGLGKEEIDVFDILDFYSEKGGTHHRITTSAPPSAPRVNQTKEAGELMYKNRILTQLLQISDAIKNGQSRGDIGRKLYDLQLYLLKNKPQNIENNEVKEIDNKTATLLELCLASKSWEILDISQRFPRIMQDDPETYDKVIASLSQIITSVKS